MDRRTILAVLLCLVVYYGWLIARGGLEPGDTDVLDPALAEAEAEGLEATPPEPVAEPTPAAVPTADHPIRDVAFSACRAEGSWSTDGGVLRRVDLLDFSEPYNVEPLYSWAIGLVAGSSSTPWKPYGDPPGPVRVISEQGAGLAIGTGAVGSPATRMQVVEERADLLTLRGVTADGIEVRQTATATGQDPCVIDIETSWHNRGATAFSGPLWVGSHDTIEAAGGGMLAAYTSVTMPRAHIDGSVYSADVSSIREESESHEGEVSWFGIANRYFGLMILPEDRSGGLSFTAHGPEEDSLVGSTYQVADGLAPGGRHEARFRIYVGPLETGQLRSVDETLVDVIDYGWFSFFAHPLLWLLQIFYAGVANWGLAIVMLTLTVKLIFFPLTQTAFKSSQAMSALQPEMQRLREEYADNNEELNRQMMELFKEHGVNPLGGCLPMLIQFPVWIALYNVLLSSVDLYQTPFLYLRDLSSADPYMALPVVVVVLMMIQQQFTPTGNMDPAQARMMKMMPLFFGIFFFILPSGLVVYIFMNMLLSIIQQWLIKRTWQKPPPAATVAVTPTAGK